MSKIKRTSYLKNITIIIAEVLLVTKWAEIIYSYFIELVKIPFNLRSIFRRYLQLPN
jgi:hypothetical protein